jgi:hypothetical protein
MAVIRTLVHGNMAGIELMKMFGKDSARQLLPLALTLTRHLTDGGSMWKQLILGCLGVLMQLPKTQLIWKA